MKIFKIVLPWILWLLTIPGLLSTFVKTDDMYLGQRFLIFCCFCYVFIDMFFICLSLSRLALNENE